MNLYLRWAAEGNYAHLSTPHRASPACGGRHRLRAAGEGFFAPDDAPVCAACVAVRIVYAERQINYYQDVIAALRAMR